MFCLLKKKFILKFRSQKCNLKLAKLLSFLFWPYLFMSDSYSVLLKALHSCPRLHSKLMEEMGLEHESPGSQSDVLSTMCSRQKGCQFIPWLRWIGGKNVKFSWRPLRKFSLSSDGQAFEWNDETNKSININPMGTLLGPKTMVSAAQLISTLV